MRRLRSGRATMLDGRAVERFRTTLAGEGATPLALAMRAAQRYLRDAMPDRAASLAYYGMLSLFPSLMIVSAATRLIGVDGAGKDVSKYAREHGASSAIAGVLRSAVDTAQSAPAPSAGVIGLAGLLSLIYGASRSFTAAGRALDTIGGRAPVPRPIVRRAEDIGWTLILVVMGIASIVLLALSGAVLGDFLGLFGVSGAAVTIWTIARWPAAVALALVAIAIVKWAAPTGTRPPFRLLTPGAIVSMATWLVASIGFGIYVRSIATYNATYGAFAGAVILLLWIWLGAAAMLYGAEVDAELADERKAAGTESKPPPVPVA